MSKENKDEKSTGETKQENKSVSVASSSTGAATQTLQTAGAATIVEPLASAAVYLLVNNREDGDIPNPDILGTFSSVQKALDWMKYKKYPKYLTEVKISYLGAEFNDDGTDDYDEQDYERFFGFEIMEQVIDDPFTCGYGDKELKEFDEKLKKYADTKNKNEKNKIVKVVGVDYVKTPPKKKKLFKKAKNF
jgi:hypothetical protein